MLVRVLGDLLDRRLKLGSHPFVGIEVENPVVLEVDIFHRPVLVGRPVIEFSWDDSGTEGFGDFYGPVGAERIEDDHIVAEADGFEAAGQVLLFVECEDKD